MDQSRLILEDELKACSRSKRSLSQRLCKTETNLLAIITKYQEELNLATAHEHRVADEYAQVYEEKEARGRVIDSLHQEATMWMDRFALTLNGSQELPRLLAKAKAMADTYSAPEEIHELLGYWKNTITKRAPRHPYHTRSKSRTMGDQEKTQEQMKTDMSAMKEQMASMMEAMLGMRQLMEKNMTTVAIISSAAEADPTLLATAHHPPPNTLVSYMPSNFADQVFARERIEVGLKRGKFDYVSSTSANAKRIGATGAKRKEGDAHAVTSAPAWVKPPQTFRGTHQYAQHHPSFSAHAGNSSSSTPVQPRVPAPIQREASQVLAPTTTRPAGNSNTMRNFPPKPIPEFTPLPMMYEDLLSSLIANQMAVITPGKIYQPPFPKWYDPNATCTYHGNTPGHSIEKCLALKYKVQNLIDVGWLTFQEDRPNVKTNPLTNHGGGAVNAIESDRSHRSKPLKDVATPRRFIFEALQKGGVIAHGGHKEDSCLLHPGKLHNMETCLAVEELLQRMIDQGRLEVGDEGREEQHICMQSADERSFGKPKPLVIYFTKDAAPQKPQYPPATKPIPFPYQNSHAVPWRYTPPSERKEETTDVSSLSAKDNSGITSLISAKGNRGKFGLGYKPTRADIKKGMTGRKSRGQGSRQGQEVKGGPPCHISRSFISAGLGHEGQVIAICEDDSPSGSELV
ncbi:hypothetical protein HKD37_08G023028 [Glycine soja]